MITLISIWTIRSDISDSDRAALMINLQSLAGTVEDAEPQTLAYRVHTGAADPRNRQNSAEGSAGTGVDSRHITFYEIYECERSFQIHLEGKPFNNFLRDNLQYFEENPDRKGYPLTKTTFLNKESAFFRSQADQA